MKNHYANPKQPAKNAIFAFCDKSFSGCSTSRAAAHILGRPVLGQIKAGIHPCIVINKKDDDRRGAFKNNPLHGAGYCLDPEFHSHDHSACPEALQDLFCMCDKVHGARSQESGKAQPDWSCAYKAKAGILQNKTVWANAANIPPEAWYEMYVKPGTQSWPKWGCAEALLSARGARRDARLGASDGPADVPLVAAWRFFKKN